MMLLPFEIALLVLVAVIVFLDKKKCNKLRRFVMGDLKGSLKMMQTSSSILKLF
jgi:hypothetical protein